jgi:hypothetical protein
MLELKRSDANGSSILFSNSAGNLGKLGFTSNGVFHLGTGTSTDGVGNLLQISTTGATTFYNSVTAPSFIGSLSGNASTATKLQTARTIAGISFDGSSNIDIPFANLINKPTTLSGYGITDAPTKTGVGASGT